MSCSVKGRRGDEVPPDAVAPGSRDERIRRALADLEAERQAAERQQDTQARSYLDAVAAGQAPGGHVPDAAQAAAAKLRLDRAEAAQQALIVAREQRDAQARARGTAASAAGGPSRLTRLPRSAGPARSWSGPGPGPRGSSRRPRLRQAPARCVTSLILIRG